jgi:hypothetical protein
MPTRSQEYDWTPPKVAGMSSAARVSTAVADVKCKEKVHLVQRLADIEAGIQLKLISQHVAALAAYRTLWRARLVAAQKVIESYGGSFSAASGVGGSAT